MADCQKKSLFRLIMFEAILVRFNIQIQLHQNKFFSI